VKGTAPAVDLAEFNAIIAATSLTQATGTE
jgi:hypothetical protein